MKTREEMLSMGIMAMTPEQRREAQRKGGLATQAKLRRKKHMRELAEAILNMPLKNADEIADALRVGGLDEEDVNYAAGIIMVQTKKAMSGDTKAAEYVRDTSGQKPVDGLVVGNLEDKPFETIDLASLSEEELIALMAAKNEQLEGEE